MQKLRVLIVDDSTVIRRLLSEALSADPEIEVVGTAANGKIALAKLPQLKPDLVTLDIEMPEMDGLETLTEVRKLYPRLPVIMFSTLTERGAQTTLEALSRGATDYVTKPSNVGSVGAAIQSVQSELIPKIKVFCKRSSPITLSSQKPSMPAMRPPLTSPVTRPQRVDALVIGTSTGGPNALALVLPQIPADFPVPIFIVQHMPPVFTARLAERLNQLSAIEVVEAKDKMLAEPGKAYLAPGDFHMTLRRQGTSTVIVLNQDAPECSCRPAVDVLFRTASKLYTSNMVSLVLTGMGQDGMKGCELIRKAGGYVIAQDEPTSVVWGMPGAVARSGLAHQILPLEKIGVEVSMLVRQSRAGRAQPFAGAANK